MIILASKEEKELLQRLRAMSEAVGYAEEIVTLKRQITDLEVAKSKLTEEHAREDRELRHMIGLEKKRQEVELVQAKKDVELTVRENNLAADKSRFEEQLKFNTQRFEKMETYFKEMLDNILERLPNINVEVKRR